MATIELGPGSTYTDQSMGIQNFLRRPLLPAIRWGAVLAGVAVGISVQLVLALLGIATGLSTLNIAEGEQPGTTGPLLWGGLCMLVSAFIAGYVTARMSGLKRKADGILHGAVSWAVTTLMFVVLATSVSGSLLSGIFNNADEALSAASTAAWVIFLAVSLSLAVSIGGGVLGAAGSRRTSWGTTADTADETTTKPV